MGPRSRALFGGTPGTLALDQALVSGAGFALNLILVRGLGLEGFGTYVVLATFGLFVTGLQLALVSQPMLSLAPRFELYRPEYYGAVLVQELAFTLLAACAAILGVPLLLGSGIVAGSWLVAPTVLYVVASQTYVFARNAFFAQGNTRRALVHDAIVYPSQVLLVAALWITGHLEVANVLAALGSVQLLAAISGLWSLGPLRFSAPTIATVWRRTWASGRWLGLMAVFQWGSANAFLLAVSAVLGVAAAGAIKAAHTIAGALHVAFLAVENGLPVRAATTLQRSGEQELERQLGRVLTYGTLATGAVALVMAACARPLLELAYGSVAPLAVTALEAFALLYVFAFVQTVFGIAFRTVERTRALATTNILMALPVVVLARPIVEHFGFAGGVYGMALQKLALVLALGAVFLWPRRTAQAAREPAKP